MLSFLVRRCCRAAPDAAYLPLILYPLKELQLACTASRTLGIREINQSIENHGGLLLRAAREAASSQRTGGVRSAAWMCVYGLFRVFPQLQGGPYLQFNRFKNALERRRDGDQAAFTNVLAMIYEPQIGPAQGSPSHPFWSPSHC